MLVAISLNAMECNIVLYIAMSKTTVFDLATCWRQVVNCTDEPVQVKVFEPVSHAAVKTPDKISSTTGLS